MPSNEMTPAQRQLSEGSGIRGDWGSDKKYTATTPASTATTPAPPSTGLAELGALLREEGVTGPNDGMDSWWRSCADAGIKHLVAIGEPFSADHVVALVPEPEHPCQWGARLHAAVRDGVIRPVGYVPSTRPSRHRGVQRPDRGGAAR